jgi:2,5-diketo-D-gluconate reductase A
MPNDIPKLTLNNGVQMPVLGFGVYQIPAEQTEQAVSDALAIGYRSLDTAAAYRNEEGVGRAIAASGIPRDELFVTTKLWIQNVGEGHARRAFEASLKRLGLDYVDLYLIHQPLGDYYRSWREMQELNREGLAKAIGVSNFYPDRLVDLIAHNESWGPFAEGQNNIFSDPVLSEIGAAHGRSVAQTILRWLIQRDVVVIPKSVRPERMRENIDVFDFELTADDMARIAEMDTGATLFFNHDDPTWVSRLNSVRVD